MNKSAIFSHDRKYRYQLSRIWDSDKPLAVFVMLNPSTADDVEDAPTIRRCIRFAHDWGYGGMRVMNLFPLVSPDPKRLLVEKDASANEYNETVITNYIKDAGIVIAAWGCFKEARTRSIEILKMLNGNAIYCLGITKYGFPKHPLYIRADTKPVLFKEA
jgi:hypothetical protein